MNTINEGTHSYTHLLDKLKKDLVSRRVVNIISPEYETKPFPLKYLLLIYTRARIGSTKHLWCDKSLEFKLLADWLKPIVYKHKGLDMGSLAIELPNTQSEFSQHVGLPMPHIVECYITEVLPELNTLNTFNILNILNNKPASIGTGDL